MGDDTYVLDVITDVVVELAGEGVDTIAAGWSYTLASTLENLVLSGNSAINGTGNSANNFLTGNSAGNILDGKAGADSLAGGAGDDSYVIDNTTDLIIELAGEGYDIVYSTVNNYTLNEGHIERLDLGSNVLNGTGNAESNWMTGNTAANLLSGAAGVDTLVGLAGNDTLDGGSGADKLFGGLGDDTYIADNAADAAFENAGEGTDTVLSSVSIALKANVENLALTGSTNSNAYGNALDNALTGNSGNNLLDGGAGSDTLTGGLGNDTYVLDTTTDTIMEATGGGIDTVQAGWTYTLAANFENLELTGTVSINGTGNSAANVLTGNSAANFLDGKAGADILIGGLGDDSYYIDNVGDLAVEAAGNGYDDVYSRVDYSLGLALDRLYLLEGSAARNAVGNERNNVLTGNSAANIFYGGLGDDLMIGAAGNDTYYHAYREHADTIKDFDATVGNTDTLVFQSGISHDQLWFRRVDNSLIVNLLDSGEKVSIQGWYDSTNNQVEVIRTEDGNKTLLASQVQNLVNAMASMAMPDNATLTAAEHAVLDAVLAANWS